METTAIMSQVYQSNLMSRAVSVFMYLMGRANRHMQCFPGIRTIAGELKMSEPTVKRALRDLVAAGFVQKETRWRANGGQSSNLYILKTVEKPTETVDAELIPVDNTDEISVENTLEAIPTIPVAADEPQLQDSSLPDCEPIATEAEPEKPVDTHKANPEPPCAEATVKKHVFHVIFQPVVCLIAKLCGKFSALSGVLTPAPGHEFTPNVNLSFYHKQIEKYQAEKKIHGFRL